MVNSKHLFFIVLSAAIATALTGCATNGPALVAVAKPAPNPAMGAPVARGSDRSRPASAPRAAQPTQRSPEMLFAALSAAGFDYRRGGKSHASGFDCSGLVAHVF